MVLLDSFFMCFVFNFLLVFVDLDKILIGNLFLEIKLKILVGMGCDLFGCFNILGVLKLVFVLVN